MARDYTLVTGATGFLGRNLLNRLEGKIRVLSRNEGKLIELKEDFPDIEIMTGSIEDDFTVQRALEDVDKVYHLAAFKHVGLAETQPVQCFNTNCTGTYNLLRHFNGNQFIFISTDKAAQVSGVYGATKMIMERMIKEFAGVKEHCKYTIVRYGNVLYSTGSVLCKWKKLIQEGKTLTVTDPDATRFFFTVDQAVNLIFEAEQNGLSGVPYCGELKAMSVRNLIEAMQQKYGRVKFIKQIGLQPGENMHEKILDDGPYSNEVKQYTIEEIKELI